MSRFDALCRVDIPDGSKGPWTVEKFDVPEISIEHMQIALTGRDAPPAGTYTRLCRNGAVWMSDTPAEIRDMIGPLWQIQNESCKRVLIHGLGLGCIVKAALSFKHVEHVDVVEIDDDVIELIGPVYEADDRVAIHRGDALTYQFPPRTRWNVVWHDIWRDLCGDNLPEMKTLHRRYGRRTDWQGSWGRSWLEAHGYR